MCLHVFPKSSFLFSSNCNVLWDRLIKQIFQECFKFISYHYSNCCIFLVKTMRKNSEIDRNKSTQYKVKLWHYKWLLLITENHFNARAHLHKERYAPASQPGPLVWQSNKLTIVPYTATPAFFDMPYQVRPNQSKRSIKGFKHSTASARFAQLALPRLLLLSKLWPWPKLLVSKCSVSQKQAIRPPHHNLQRAFWHHRSHWNFGWILLDHEIIPHFKHVKAWSKA